MNTTIFLHVLSMWKKYRLYGPIKGEVGEKWKRSAEQDFFTVSDFQQEISPFSASNLHKYIFMGLGTS